MQVDPLATFTNPISNIRINPYLYSMITIEVKTIYKDYEIPYDQQEYHDLRIDLFKGTLETIVKNYPQQIIHRMVVDCEYYPDKRKFKIVSVTREHKTRVDYTLGMNEKFVREFLIK